MNDEVCGMLIKHGDKCVAKHAQIIQNIKLAIFLQYLKKEVSDEVDFCMKISMKVFYKLILWFLMGMIKHFQSFPNSNFAISLQNLKKEVRDEVVFFSLR